MKKYTLTSIFGIIGIITWIATILLREIQINNVYISFILGIMSNISATWLFIWFGEVILNRKNIYFNFKIASSVSILILIFAIISEIIHDMYLNSPFDIYDIIATTISIAIYLIFFCYSKNTSKIKK